VEDGYMHMMRCQYGRELNSSRTADYHDDPTPNPISCGQCAATDDVQQGEGDDGRPLDGSSRDEMIGSF